METAYDVFISHAGEDKETLAVPIYEALKRRGISSFLDRKELRTGGKAAGAMLNAVDVSAIGLCILSPEYGAKNWPMLELERFLRNIERARSAGGCKNMREPVLIPIFYRLGVADCKDRQLFTKYTELLQRKDLVDRLISGETSLKDILDNLEELSRRTGIENKVGATNENTEYMSMKRERLVETICEEVSQALSVLQSGGESRSTGGMDGNGEDDTFRAEFYVPGNPAGVRLDFSSALTSDVSQTPEAEVMRKVLCRDEKTEQNRVVVIKGIGGVGKSCTLRALGREKEVQRRFGGGVYFISLGMDATVNTLIGELLKILRLSGARKLAQKLLQEKDLDVILASVGRWMKGKRILVLVDDLWDRKSLGASIISRLLGILEGESESMVVVTTRFNSIGSMGNMVEMKPLEAISGAARSILLGYACLNEAGVMEWNLEETVKELLRICGGLPVCLAAMGRSIGELMQYCGGDKGLALRRYLELTSRKRWHLVEMGIEDYMDLRTTLCASLEVLEESRTVGLPSYCRWSYVEMHRSLCVLQKPAVAPISVLCRLWGVEKEEEAWMIVKGFADVGSASIEVNIENEMDCIRLHDLIHDFVIACADAKRESCVWHRRLLEGYLSIGDVEGVEKKVREWWRVGDEYLLSSLSWHLVRGERVSELVSLLLRCEWTKLRSKQGGIVALKGDFSECLKGLERSKDLGEEKEVIREGLCVIRDAVLESWGYIQGNWNEIGFQMWGRVGQEAGWGVLEYLKSIDEHQGGPWLKTLKPLKQNWADESTKGLDGEFVLDGMVESITQISGSRYAVSAGGEVVVVDIDNMIVLNRFCGRTRDVVAVGVKKQNARVVSCSEDGVVIDWNVKNGENVEKVALEISQEGEEYSGGIKYAVFDPNITFISTCGWGDDKVEMWDSNTGVLLARLESKCSTARQRHKRMLCMEVSKYGKYIARGTSCGIDVWDVSRKSECREVMNGEGYALHIAFHPNEEVIASVGFGKTIDIWDIRTGIASEIVYPDSGFFTCIAFDGDGQRIAAGLSSGVVSVWDLETRSFIVRYSPRLPSWVHSVQFGADKDVILFGCTDIKLKVWNMSDSLDFVEDDSECSRGKITCIRISPDGSFYVSGCSDGTVLIWNSNGQERRGSALEHEARVECIAISSDSLLIGTGAQNGNVRIWDAIRCEQKGEPLRGHSEMVESIAFSPDNQFLVSCSEEDVRIWSTGEGKQIGRMVPSVHNPRSSMLVSAIAQVGKAVRRTCTGVGLSRAWAREYVPGPDSVAVTPDGKRAISGLANGTIWMWEIETGKLVCEQNWPANSAYRITFPQNNIAKIYSEWKRPSYWYLDDDKGMVRIGDDEIQGTIPYFANEEYPGHCDEIACTHDGRYLIWRADGRKLGTLPVRANKDAWVYDSSRKVIVIGGVDGHVYFYKLMT